MQDKKITNLQEAYNLIDKYPFYYCSCSKELKEDFELAIYAVAKDISNYDNLIDEFKNDKTIVSLAIKVNPEIIYQLSDELLKDSSIKRDIIDSLNSRNYDMEDKYNRQFIADVVKKIPEEYMNLSPTYRSYNKVITAKNLTESRDVLDDLDLTDEQKEFIKDNKLENIINIIDNYGFCISSMEDNGIELEYKSNYDGVYYISFNFDGTAEDFINEFENYYESFDIEEYVNEGLECKMNGDMSVPSLEQLVYNAKEIEVVLNDCYEDLYDCVIRNKNKSLDEQIAAAQLEVEDTITTNKDNLER